MKKAIPVILATIFVSHSSFALADNVSRYPAAKISAQKARTLATQRVGGGVVTDIDRKRHYYEVDVRRGKVKYEVHVNAQTGRAVINETDRDDDYDD